MSGQIEEAQVRHVAHLSRLKLSDRDIERFTRELSAILGYVAQLNELDTSGVPPTSHALPVTNVFREDEPGASLGTDLTLGNAPQRQQTFFQVPKVLDQEGS